MSDVEPTVTVWITSWALTQGVLKVEAQISDTGLSVFWGRHRSAYGENRNWHRTEAAAVARAEKMRLVKIESLRLQIGKLEAMTFEASEP